MHQLQAHFSKIPKYCFNTSNGTEAITVSILFRRLKNTVFLPPGIGNTSTLKSSKRTQNRNTPFTTEARVGKANAQRFFFLLVGPSAVVLRVPSQVLCRKVALQRAHLRVSACTDRLVSPCHHRPVSSLRPRICLVGRSQPHTAPSQRRCDRREDKKTKQTSIPDFAIWDDMAVIFTVYNAARRLAKNAKLKN